MEHSYQTASFSEMISETSTITIASNFDIILDQNNTLQNYCDTLMRKIFELPHTDYPAFISYQTNLVKEPTLWLNHFEELISNNEDQFSGKKSLCRYHKLLNQIEFRRKELQSTSVNETKSNTPKRLINADSEDRHFSFFEVKERVEKMEKFNDKILFITEEVFDYKQADIISINKKLQPFDEQCCQLIEKLHTVRKMKADFEKEQSENNETKNTNAKLQFNGNVNQLVDVFYQLNRELFVEGKSFLEGNSCDIANMIVNSFVDKEGNEISPQTVETILKPSRTDKRPKPHKRIDIDKIL
ncbi:MULTISPECIES: hypothetical protein [Flavobacterium]|uniref:hypothetical protein n=1 Tax=Flavobacterium TaxID=237 RepID=UPI001FCCA1E0|nr:MULTISPECIES: hypothetical protein [Flavobacterium]UOK42126.1 hypothetical protein LZF87_12505 [Flavobacterium enshiense]